MPAFTSILPSRLLSTRAWQTTAAWPSGVDASSVTGPVVAVPAAASSRAPARAAARRARAAAHHCRRAGTTTGPAHVLACHPSGTILARLLRRRGGRGGIGGRRGLVARLLQALDAGGRGLVDLSLIPI